MQQHDISDIKTYTARMEMGVFDKLFWTEHIFEPVDKIVDFGCGDGVVLGTYRSVRGTGDGTPLLVAVDDNPAMRAAAKERLGEDGVQYLTGLDEMLAQKDYSNSLLLMSSVIHEIFSSNDKRAAKRAMKRIFDAGFKYIAIRDMATEEINARQRIKSSKYSYSAYKKICKLMPEKVKEFESIWGKINNRRDLIHFLLKYRYTENWDREVRENYLPLFVEDFIAMVPSNYEVIFVDTYTHPYTKYAVERDIGIDLTDHTHIKLILRRKD